MLVRPSRNTLDAALAALLEVVFFVRDCESAEPAADLLEFPVDLLFRVFDALDAAERDVFF